MVEALSSWEAGVLFWIQNHLRNPVTDPAVTLFTHLGDYGIFFILLTVGLLLWPRTRRIGFAAALALLFSLLFTNIALKNLVQRPRPWVSFPFLRNLVTEWETSFPSGHTSVSFAFALAVAGTADRRPARVTAVALAVLMGLSRLYVGAHYPSDVLAGLIVGTLAGLLGRQLAAWLRRRFPRLDAILSAPKKDG